PPGSHKGSFGNWVRLPGRHHTRDFWSRVWTGEEWVEGDEAIDLILTIAGDPVRLIPSSVIQEVETDRRRRYGRSGLVKEVTSLAIKPTGQRHDSQRDSALKIAGLVRASTLTEEEGRRAFLEAARANGLIAEGREDEVVELWES